MFRARLLFAADYARHLEGEEQMQGCLLWASAVRRTLIAEGYEDALIAAGSTHYTFREYGTDEDTHQTTFAYEFIPREAARRIQEGKLPEMHVWAMLGMRQAFERARLMNKGVMNEEYWKDVELIDLTTGHQHAQLARILPGEYFREGFEPPEWLWINATESHPTIKYRMEPTAMDVAVSMLASFHEEHPEIVL